MKKSSGLGFVRYLIGFAIIAMIFGAANNSSTKPFHNPTYRNKNYSYATPVHKAQPEVTYTCSDGTKYESYSDYLSCENLYNWKATRDKSLAECNADSSKFNCWYDEYPGTTLHWEYYTYTAPSYQAPSSSGVRYGAICRDGTQSSATGRGACSHHGGVSMWLTY